ncbi:MAG: hypothetical protein QOJ97_1543 [Solirubrobacteraceae bacterium]|jgi:hypothetical protein|nr:hypothetical protein [Solirubrobacteraceae bacterium]
MAIKQSSGYCNHCQQPRPFSKNAPNHVLHFVVSLFTVGLWIPVWIVLSVKAAGSSAICTACGLPKGSGAPTGAVQQTTTQQWAAGWYPDANDPTHEKYWDGHQWSEHRRPLAQPNGATESEPNGSGQPAVELPRGELAGEPAPVEQRGSDEPARAEPVAVTDPVADEEPVTELPEAATQTSESATASGQE